MLLLLWASIFREISYIKLHISALSARTTTFYILNEERKKNNSSSRSLYRSKSETRAENKYGIIIIIFSPKILLNDTNCKLGKWLPSCKRVPVLLLLFLSLKEETKLKTLLCCCRTIKVDFKLEMGGHLL